MGRSAMENATTKVLLGHLGQASTGSIAAGQGAGRVLVYVLNGDVVASEAGDDAHKIIRRLKLAEALTPKQLTSLEGKIDQSEGVMGDVLTLVPAAILDEVLLDIFKENVSRYVGSFQKPEWNRLDAVFVENIQIGHDSRLLVQDAAAAWDAAQTIDLDAQLGAGKTRASDKAHKIVRQALGKKPLTVSALLHVLPIEEVSARATIAEMIELGMITVAEPAPPPAPPVDDDDLAPLSIDPSTRPPDGDPTEEETIEAAALRMTALKHLAPEPEASDVDPDTEEPPELEPDDDSDEVDPGEAEEADPGQPQDPAETGASPSAPEPELAAAPPAAADETSDTEDVGDPISLDTAALSGDLPLDDPSEETGAAAADPGQTAEGVANLSSLNAWLTSATEVSEDELDAFSDHDYDRGKGEGGFSTEAKDLDKIAVTVEEDNRSDEPLEIDEAPTSKYNAPVIHEEEGLAKLAVCNEVLRVVVKAFDEAEGSGRGQSVAQLLVDGSPAAYKVLFQGVPVADDGEVPAAEIFENLYTRPPSEHRRLLNQALADLIERALSAAADDLPEDKVDTILETVAGYRQRLGL